jgi:hypothetical protein
VLILFALCGAGSAVVSFDRFPEGSFIFPFPFALLCAVLFLRRSRQGQRAFFVVPLIMTVWYLSYFSAFTLGMGLPVYVGLVNSAIACIVGGLVGGAGLVLCASLCSSGLASTRYIALGATLGICSAFSFLPRLYHYEMNLSQGFPKTPIFAFALWEAVMGTFLYATCTLVIDREYYDSPRELEVNSFRITPQ